MVASGARPVLAGRDRGRLNALAAQLARTGEGIELETAVAGIVVSERTAARVTSFELDGKTRQAFSIRSSEHFALPRLRPGAAGAAGAAGSLAQAPLTEVGVYLGWFGAATRLVHYAAALATPGSRPPGVHRALDQRAHRIQRNRAGPGTQAAIRSDVVAVAGDASGRNRPWRTWPAGILIRSPRRSSPGRRARRHVGRAASGRARPGRGFRA
jgi:hypothetical protein